MITIIPTKDPQETNIISSAFCQAMTFLVLFHLVLVDRMVEYTEMSSLPSDF